MADISLNEFETPPSLDEFSIGVVPQLDFNELGLQTPVPPVLVVAQPIGNAIGTQTLWEATLTLPVPAGIISRIIIDVAYPTGIYETVYINGAFTPNYNGKSTMVESPPGVFTIKVIRNGGWPGSPRLFVHANTDRGGMTE